MSRVIYAVARVPSMPGLAVHVALEARGLARLGSPDIDGGRGHDRRARLFVPWKAMIVASVVLTILVNLLLWLT